MADLERLSVVGGDLRADPFAAVLEDLDCDLGVAGGAWAFLVVSLSDLSAGEPALTSEAARSRREPLPPSGNLLDLILAQRASLIK